MTLRGPDDPGIEGHNRNPPREVAGPAYDVRIVRLDAGVPA